jgi:antitoxin component of MazEF toxin-antitoxin module
MTSSRLTVTKWGNGYGFRLPRGLLATLQAKSGDRFDVEATPGTLVLRIVEQDGSESARNDARQDEETLLLLDFDAVQRSLRSIVDQADRLSEAMERRVEAAGGGNRRVLDRHQANRVIKLP